MRRTTILVADDEHFLTFMLAARLRDCGADVLVAANGEDALLLACEHLPDLVLTDFQMPRMSGLELAKKLKESPETADIPLIMLTARGHRVPPAELAATSIRHLISKPFSLRELLSVIGEICKLEDLGGATKAA